jgi:hypothetical protein
VATDRTLADRIVDSQEAALDRLIGKDFGGTLLRFIDRIQASPRREHPPVAFDFWEQVHEAEALDELRPFRPGAFMALPKEPVGSRPSTALGATLSPSKGRESNVGSKATEPASIRGPQSR